LRGVGIQPLVPPLPPPLFLVSQGGEVGESWAWLAEEEFHHKQD